MILVISSYRSGSTWFCQQLAKSTGYVNLDEMFHENLAENHKHHLRKLISLNNSIVKIFPFHLSESPINNLLDLLIQLSEKIIILVRKNTYDQCKSLYIAKSCSNWHEKNINLTITYDPKTWNRYYNFLDNEITEIKKIINKIPNAEIVYLEDLNQAGNYHRQIFWDIEPPLIPSKWL